jgi:hypothetical protein
MEVVSLDRHIPQFIEHVGDLQHPSIGGLSMVKDTSRDDSKQDFPDE